MKKLDYSKPSGFNSNNIIPKEVRKLFKKKYELSKQLRKVTSVKICSNIRDSILRLDIEIKNHYEDGRRLVEERLFIKSQENKNFIYCHIKRAQKSISKIGPFLQNGKYEVSDPASFFTPVYNYSPLSSRYG